jgi:hypothetical protein
MEKCFDMPIINIICFSFSILLLLYPLLTFLVNNYHFSHTQIDYAYSENPKSKMLQNPKLFQHWYDVPNRNFCAMKLCFTHKMIKNII